MPLEKRWRGRRVSRTKRRGQWILVRLAAEPHNNLSAEWIRLTQQAYMSERRCIYRPRPQVVTTPGGLP
jgi:hypothetical protein